MYYLGIKYRTEIYLKKILLMKMRVIIKLNPNDLMGEIGFGMDFYLEFLNSLHKLKFPRGVVNLLDRDQTVYTKSIKNLYTNGWTLSFTFE